MDESTKQKFDEKLKELIEIAKTKKNTLEDHEISAHFAEMPLEEEQFDRILETLEKNNIDVLRITEEEEEPVDEELLLAQVL